ncbi:bifunctional 2',3'-cyclic-nucleotide 2'-phosphodiesterase/3'-nucleotidase [Silvanigrella sp.]|jgi:2',3'-cyclic-nucleotide 2'-phosphodiesterase/3'-nucleotidase|uniref:bifunctional 2',3'-cyclic-nucleotide 2'-phosphodiesterase/3'-nucleotidase n=1 Tax=Silvanigrella sp. TaxID=2024976 RepID=UPI0037C82A45
MTSPPNCYQLAILETSDLHCYIVPYDYYNDKKSELFGLAKTATLIKKFQKIYKNNILVDNGDLIQGNALSDYVSRYKPLEKDKNHPIFKVMNYLNYDIATVGNHDFNYGLDFLKKVTNQASFPYICSNIYLFDEHKENNIGEPLYPESYIIEKKFEDNTSIKIGFIGVAPPQILIWDKHILDNKIIIKDIVESSKKHAIQLKKNGADLVIALAHSGILPLKYIKNTENAVYELTKIKQIDAVFSGHAHNIFPGGKVFQNLDKYKIDNTIGKINNTPVVMPGALGSHLGIIRFNLEKKKTGWKINQSFSEIHSVKDVEPDSKVISLVEEENKNVLNYIRSYVGKSNIHFYSWFSSLEDSYTSQFIQKIAIEFATKKFKNTKWENLPILCSFAPLNTGTHGSSFINIPKGPLAIKDISNLYPYDNEIKVLLVNGEQIKDWLEFSAQTFHQIDVGSSEEIFLLNLLFPTFNFDCIFGITYEIDLTKKLGNRILNIQFNKRKIKPKQLFGVVTNNYRAAGGGNFPNINKFKTILDSTELYRNILIEKVKNTEEIDFTLEENWKILPILSPNKQTVYFESSLDSIPYHPRFLILLSKDEALKKAKYRIDVTKF